MSEIKYIACDKCGKKIDECQKHASIYMQINHTGHLQTNRSYDFCERCLTMFNDWMKDNESEINN